MPCVYYFVDGAAGAGQQLDTASLAEGIINGENYGPELSASDCFEIGRQSYNNEDYYHTTL